MDSKRTRWIMSRELEGRHRGMRSIEDEWEIVRRKKWGNEQEGLVKETSNNMQTLKENGLSISTCHSPFSDPGPSILSSLVLVLQVISLAFVSSMHPAFLPFCMRMFVPMFSLSLQPLPPRNPDSGLPLSISRILLSSLIPPSSTLPFYY